MAIVAECLTPDALETHAPMIEFCHESQREVYAAVGEAIMQTLAENNFDYASLPVAYIIQLADGRTVGLPFQVTSGETVTQV